MSKLKVVGTILLIPIILIAMFAVSSGWKYVTAHWRGKVDAEQKIESGDSQISNYNHYFDMCSVAQTRQQALETQQSLLEDAETSKERTRIRSNVAGMQAQLNRIINQYNADAKKEYTMARFKDSSLPARLDADRTIFCTAK